MSQNDTDFMVGLVQQVPALATSTFVTLTPKPVSPDIPSPLPYALIHPTPGVDEQTRLTGPPSTEHPEFTIHLAGESAEQCQVATDLLKAQVMPDGFGVIPEVAGRRNQHMFWRQPIPIQTNTDLTPPLCFAVVETGWTSDPA